MSDSGGKILLQSLTEEEYNSIPEPLRVKIESCVNEHVESFTTSRALFETTRASNEEKIKQHIEQISILEKEREDLKNDLSALKDELSEVQLNLEASKNDNEKLQLNIKKLEEDCVELRRQRDLAVDERHEAIKMVERRNNELQRLQEDITVLTSQRQAAVEAKCAALANTDDLESMKLALSYKEKRLDQERELLNQQVQSLTEDIAKHSAEMTNMRREYTNNLITLRTQLGEKTEELKIAATANTQLSETNAALNKRVEALTQKLIGHCESENKMNENYQQEISAQTRLAELYKGLSEDAQAKNEELTNAVKELQGLLKDATQQYGVLETQLKEQEVALEVTTEKKNLCIQELKKELEHANELLDATKKLTLEKAVESLSPAAAATSRLLSSGLTLTQLYMQYAEVSEQLMLEKEENKRLNQSMNMILQEIEQKAPILKKQREDYDYAMTTVETLTTRMDELEVETARLRSANFEVEKAGSYLKRENERLQKAVSDLGRQVCFLLKGVEEARGGIIETTATTIRRSDDITTSAEVISKHLVTFKDIQELQLNNQKLLSVVRDLSEKQEQAERENAPQAVAQLEAKLRLAEQRVASLKESEQHYVRAMEVVKGQREMYRTLFQQQVAGLPPSKVAELETSMNQQKSPGQRSHPSTPESSPAAALASPVHQMKIELLEQRLKEKAQEIHQLQDDFNSYRKEKAVNERMVNESLEKARENLRAVSVSKSELVAKAELAEERFKVLKANADSYKAQIQALEKKNSNYSNTIAKHEQSIIHLKDECVTANKKHCEVEVALENLRREYQLLKESEARLIKEREIMNRQSSGQAALMANLEMIKATFERNEAEGRMKLENKLEEAQKECCALRRRLQEEQDRFRERTDALERSTEAARKRLDEEKEITHELRTQLNSLRAELKESKDAVEQLNAKVRTTSHRVVPDPETEKRASLLEQRLAEKDGELACLHEQLASAKKHALELSEISQSSEKQLQEVTSSHNKYREESGAKIKLMEAREVEMKKAIVELESQLSSLSEAQQASASTLDGKLRSRQVELSSAVTELSTLRAEVETLRAELGNARAARQAAEDKYAHEMMLHSEDIQAMNKVKEELSQVVMSVKDLEGERDQALMRLREGQESWQMREDSLQSELKEMTQRHSDLDKQNNLLHEQLQQLGLKMAVVHTEGNTSSTSLDMSTDEDTRSSDQLLQVLKYIRREKNIAVAQTDALRAETLRLKAQVELTARQLQEARDVLEAERSQSQVSLTTTSRHEELLRKVDTLNALTDSNRLLREERDKLAEQVACLEQEAAKVETDVLAPFKERVVKLTNHIDQLATENAALKAEAARWRTRVNTLVEKQNKNSPEDFKRLSSDKEQLTKQVATVSEELKTLKSDKSKLEEQLNNLKKENQQQLDQLNNTQKSLTQIKSELTEARSTVEKKTEELTKMGKDLATQEAALSDIKNKELQIRQIAKKYKTQYQELIKTSEEDKKKKEVAVISGEEQERLRQEGRQETENRLNEKVRQLTDQVTGMATESNNLRRENEVLRTSSADKEERAKALLKNARARIMMLTEEKRTLATENTELKTRCDSVDRMKDDSDVRQRRADKEKADLVAEKERLAREVEMLTQRANLLQRQLDKLQGGGKPSTSSGVEKSTADPPTANIKPMAGPSSSVPKQQPTQHSVTVTPWRGAGSETPFASIRPMSLQSRTVAVLPTTNQNTQAVLVPPQQQMVHTSTGTVEGLSSSPTSSHTDYMPATSSAAVRQATVPPTPLPAPTAESTQDLEAEGSQASVQAGGAANPQALSIALVLPQPTPQTSSQTTQTPQDSAVGSASTGQEQGVVTSDQPGMVPAYYRQEVEESGQSVASSHAATTEQSVVASSESQLAEASNSAQQSPAPVVASSYANSSNTVTTSQAGPASKRIRDSSGPTDQDTMKSMPPAKCRRLTPTVTVTERADGLEVEYQVPTSSQRDQEDDVILVDTDDDEDEDDEGMPDDGGLDNGQEFEEEGENEEGYELEVYSQEDQEMAGYDVGEGPDIDENITDQDNNEVDVIAEDSNEVPNQSESSSSGVGVVETGGETAGGEATSSVQGLVGRNTRRASATHIPPLNRQQQLLLPGSYEDVGDDSIVPSTPTLFVPRRTDGFGEAVSSPHVPSGRFTFTDNNPPSTRAGVAQVASEGMDDTRMDLSQLEDSSTGRSVPSTPLQVSPQEPIGGEVGQSSGGGEDSTEANNNLHIPTITITTAPEMPPPSEVEDMSGEEGRETEAQDSERGEDLQEPEEGGDGVTSEGEKSGAMVDEVEEGREAEATETGPVARGSGTARRSGRPGLVRGRARNPPTPIIWDDSPSSAARGTPSGARTITMVTRNSLIEQSRGAFRARARRVRGPTQFQPRF